MKKDGTPCAGSEAFASMSPKIKTMEAGSKEHGYASWMENELKKKAGNRISIATEGTF